IPISLAGDEVESIGNGVVLLRGNAELVQGRQRLTGEELRYNRETDEIEGSGDVTWRSPAGDWLQTDSLRVQVPTQIGEAGVSEFKMAARGVAINEDTESVEVQARGTADQIFLEGAGVTRLRRVIYTTCAEGQNDVMLSASELELDQNTGRGLARNLGVRFKGVPIFYFPVLSFPINDQRKTGLLFPEFGSETDSGFVLGAPWYWNVHEQVDATITPTLYTERGGQLRGEVRYMTEQSKGQFNGEYLPGDDKFNGEDRFLLDFEHDQKFGDNWTFKGVYNDLSDTEYYNDFYNDINYYSVFFVDRQASLRYRGDWFNLGVRAHQYKAIDAGIQKPFERLPELTFSTNFDEGPMDLEYGLNMSMVDFSHQTFIGGQRFDATPYLELPLKNTWGFFRPRVELRHTQYSIDDNGVQVKTSDAVFDATGLEVTPAIFAPFSEVNDTNPSRTAPIFSLDAGVYFERRANWFGRDAIQTLEPRVFYAYAPEVDQSDLPAFSASEITFNNFGEIYRANRFYGADRVGDTNQVTLALTSRIDDSETGDRLFKGSIGTVFFLKDRKGFEGINLQNGESFSRPDNTDSVADLLGEVHMQLGENVGVYGYMQWNTDDGNVRQGQFDLNYINGARFFGIGYRYSDNAIEQVDVRAQWPLTDRWTIFGNDRFSIRDEENLETEVGFQYDGCCWRLRVFYQNRVRAAVDDRQSFLAEFELTGLARIRSGL
ncbi:MAG: LPS-assembly protein LptD, partial [Proteobacteria bacterium]|nr:LPS-assembly protein LptD [Pseudomonadota bacterium]